MSAGGNGNRLGRRAIRAVAAMFIVVLLAGAAWCERSMRVAEVTGDGQIRDAEQHACTLLGVDLPLVPVMQRMKRRDIGFVQDEVIARLRTRLVGQSVRLVPEGDDAQSPAAALAAQQAVYLYLNDGTLVNRELISDGLAHTAVQPPFSMREAFLHAEAEAMTAKRGLWHEESPTVGRSGTKSIDNQVRTQDFVARYQGPAESEDH